MCGYVELPKFLKSVDASVKERAATGNCLREGCEDIMSIRMELAKCLVEGVANVEMSREAQTKVGFSNTMY
jgi:hypothetical protein